MKLRILSFTLLLLSIIAIDSCKKKPFDNISLNINGDVMKYRAVVQIFDAANSKTVPGNIRLSVSGKDADYIYTLTGSKTFTVSGGMINIGISPGMTPTATRPVSFILVISADGYLPVSRQITITPDQTSQQIGIALTNILTPPSGIRATQTTLSLSNGVLATPNILKDGRLTQDSVYYDDKITSVVLPTGTSFYYYVTNSKMITGTRVERVNQYKDSSYQSGGATITTDPVLTSYYYDTVHFQYDSIYYTKTLYTGSTLNVVCLYHTLPSVSYAIYDSRSYGPGPDATILNGTLVKGNEMLFTSSVQDALYDIRFVGQIMVNGALQDLDISPDSSAHWFTSFVLDPATVNPVTNKVIKEGDSIEWGINPYTQTTLRTPIVKANGTLRAAVQGINVGYYYKAPYIYNFEYDLNGIVNPDNIPDPENVYASAYVDLGPNLGNGSRFYQMPVYGGLTQYAAQVCCAQSITEDVAALTVKYWNKVIKNTNLTQKTTVNVFDPPYSINLPDPVSISYQLKCSEKTIRPTYNFAINYSSSSGNSSFLCNIIDGQWKTRGLIQGQTYTISGHMCDFGISKSYTVNSNTLALSDTIAEVCNCILK